MRENVREGKGRKYVFFVNDAGPQVYVIDAQDKVVAMPDITSP